MRVCTLFALSFLFLPSMVLLQTGCIKDYSFEGRPVDSVQIINPQPITAYSTCSFCNNNVLADSSWRMTVDDKIYCGKAEKTVMNPERTGFTFFGPSACSSDSGFVATVYVENVALSTDRSNLKARLACYYYDKVGQTYLYMSDPGAPLSMNIIQYDSRTGNANGTFTGFVVTGSGEKKEIKNGAFKIRL